MINNGERLARAMIARDRHRGLSAVIDVVCMVSNVQFHRIASWERTREVVAARRAACVLMRSLPVRFVGHVHPSFPEIASVMGMSNHSTAITCNDSAHRDPLAIQFIAAACDVLGVPAQERPTLRTPETPRQRFPVGERTRKDRRQAERAAWKADRKARRIAERDAMLRFERAAEGILTRLCEHFGIARATVTGKSQCPDAMRVRHVFAAIVLDSDACGRMVTKNATAEMCGRRGNVSASEWRNAAMKRPELVASACSALGISPPEYARKAGAA